MNKKINMPVSHRMITNLFEKYFKPVAGPADIFYAYPLFAEGLNLSFWRYDDYFVIAPAKYKSDLQPVGWQTAKKTPDLGKKDQIYFMITATKTTHHIYIFHTKTAAGQQVPVDGIKQVRDKITERLQQMRFTKYANSEISYGLFVLAGEQILPIYLVGKTAFDSTLYLWLAQVLHGGIPADAVVNLSIIVEEISADKKSKRVSFHICPGEFNLSYNNGLEISDTNAVFREYFDWDPFQPDILFSTRIAYADNSLVYNDVFATYHRGVVKNMIPNDIKLALGSRQIYKIVGEDLMGKSYADVAEIPVSAHNKPYIVKKENTFKQTGITIVPRITPNMATGNSSISEYVADPLLLNGFKFHARTYVLFWAPKTQFSVFDRFVIMTAGQKYTSDLTKLDAHLSGASRTKKTYTENDLRKAFGTNYEKIKSGILGVTKTAFERVIERFPRVEIYPETQHAFSIFACDVIVRRDLTPVLLEINTSPGLVRLQYQQEAARWICEFIAKQLGTPN